MKSRYLGLLIMGLFGITYASAATIQERAGEVGYWDFDVYLNDKKVGKHEFTVSEAEGVKQVQSEASFKYKILFIPAYSYEHNAAERWAGNCLAAFDASTNANGDRIRVSGEQSESGFLVTRDGNPVALPECVMTFAYWNPDFLEQSRLLNPQTGEYVDVRVEKVGNETLEVRGQSVAATRFRLTAYEVDLTIWYSTNNEWLALESVAKGGHIIRYELS
jgi:hypothetical protein